MLAPPPIHKTKTAASEPNPPPKNPSRPRSRNANAPAPTAMSVVAMSKSLTVNRGMSFSLNHLLAAHTISPNTTATTVVAISRVRWEKN
jgi:hypothetical protein